MIHDFFESALKGMLSNLTERMQPYSEYLNRTFPILVMNTGDEVFLQNIKPDDANKTLYNSIPRMVCDIGGINVLSDQLSSMTNYGRFTIQDDITGIKSEKVANFRRIPLNITVNAQVYFSNIFQYLQFVEILLMMTYDNCVFTYYYQDKFLQGNFNYQDQYNTEPNMSLSFDSDKRHRIMNLTFEVELQFPSFDYYNTRSMLDATKAIQTVIYRVHPDDKFYLPTASIVQIPQSE